MAGRPASTKMDDRKLLRLGFLGATVAALCSFTPVLVVILGAAGLSAVVGGLDYLLFPALFASLGVIAQALYLRPGGQGPSPRNTIFVLVSGLSALLFWIDFSFALAISIAGVAMVVAYGTFLHLSRDESTA